MKTELKINSTIIRSRHELKTNKLFSFFAMRLIARLIILLGLCGLLIWSNSDTMMFRWHRVVSNFPTALSNSNEIIDVAFFGSSRMMRAIDAEAIRNKVNEQYRWLPTIYDFSKPYRGPEVDYLIVKQVKKMRKINTVVVEYKNGSSLLNRHRYQNIVARFQDLPFLFWKSGGLSIADRLRFSSDFVLSKIPDTVSMFLEGKLRDHISYGTEQHGFFDPTPPKGIIATKDFDGLANTVVPEAIEGWDINSPDTALDLYMVKNVVDLVERMGGNAVFFYIPTVKDPPLSPEFSKRFEIETGAKLLLLPASIIETIYPRGYADNSHMNQFGADIIASWLANQNILWRRN